VGPNGCGKSNIVDAVKWVLGEQSVKSLRSDQMADVIFGGSSSRKAVGTAEVSLFISNTTGGLAIEADEVQISRRIYRSGESDYRINNKICRLKDIRELFMDTGVGARAYSIIEQGQIEQLLNASKADRRVIFEEAAGISKYKAHKKEAMRKLERTEQNLLRLADILGEVGKNLRSVKLAAGKARNYLAKGSRSCR
jgi:chromosome segregation protein